MGCWSQNLHTAAIFLVYSTAEYCASVWYRSAYTRLIDSVLNDTLSIVTGFLRPTPTNHLAILSSIQPSEFWQLQAILSLVYRGFLDRDCILYGFLSGSSDGHRERSRGPFVLAAQNSLNNLARFGICAYQWTNHK